MTTTLTGKSTSELLRLYGDILDELRNRGIVRSANSPIGDYTEWLVASRLGLTLTSNSQSGHDAVDQVGTRYQIKGRRLLSTSGPAQLGVIRNLAKADFDFLIAVVFDALFEVQYAAKIPHSLVSELSTFRSHQNGHIILLRRTVLTLHGVEDLTHLLTTLA